MIPGAVMPRFASPRLCLKRSVLHDSQATGATRRTLKQGPTALLDRS